MMGGGAASGMGRDVPKGRLLVAHIHKNQKEL